MKPGWQKVATYLDWEELGRLLSFTQDTWDANQKAGYLALVDTDWGAGNEVGKHAGKYWSVLFGRKPRKGMKQVLLGLEWRNRITWIGPKNGSG